MTIADGYPDRMSAPDLTVHDDPEVSRFLLRRGDSIVGLADYVLDGDVVTIPHVETAPQHRGQGFAAQLMDGIVDAVRTDGRTIRPICPYAAQYLQGRPDTHDLVVR